MDWRRHIAGWLLIFLIAPQFGWFNAPANPESALPACCRRDGKHHCAMMAEISAHQRAASKGYQAGVPTKECPFRSQLFPPVTSHQFGLPAQSISLTGLAAHFSGVQQVRALARISETRSHQKRGPPSSIPS